MKVSVEWIYKTPKNREITLTSDVIDAKEALIFALDFERIGRTKELYFYDDQGTRWTKKEFEQLMKGIETEPHDITVFFDGGFDLETKNVGLGAAIYFMQNGKRYRIRRNEAIDELDSNNEAEYAAFFSSLSALEELGVHDIPVTFKGDSQVVLNQLAGEWPVFEEEFNRWLDRIEAKMKKLGIRPTYELISRKENKEADHLATQALKGVIVDSRIELTKENEE